MTHHLRLCDHDIQCPECYSNILLYRHNRDSKYPTYPAVLNHHHRNYNNSEEVVSPLVSPILHAHQGREHPLLRAAEMSGADSITYPPPTFEEMMQMMEAEEMQMEMERRLQSLDYERHAAELLAQSVAETGQ